jgi:Fe2+ transport system protein FeoA
MSPSRSTRLSAFGMVPGSTVTLVQSRPVPVVRLGHTELSLAEDIVEQIWVAPPPA